jgi:serine phosphatase RsbU (regulator of sigma subunit)
MANLQANLRSQSAIALAQPERFLQSVNQLFCKNTVDSAYATLFFGQYDDQARRLRFANCGHYSGVLLREGKTLERLDSTGTVLGLFPEWDCSIEERQFSPGDILALYTDGVTEAFDSSGEEYGETRLIDGLRKKRDLPPQSLLTEIVQDIQRFSGPEQYDDITLMIARCR